jgi:hypothetical protein
MEPISATIVAALAGGAAVALKGVIVPIWVFCTLTDLVNTPNLYPD